MNMLKKWTYLKLQPEVAAAATAAFSARCGAPGGEEREKEVNGQLVTMSAMSIQGAFKRLSIER